MESLRLGFGVTEEQGRGAVEFKLHWVMKSRSRTVTECSSVRGLCRVIHSGIRITVDEYVPILVYNT